MPLPEGLDRNQVLGHIRNLVKLKAQMMSVTLREVPIDAISVANEQYRARMEPRMPARYVKALQQAQLLSTAAGFPSLLAGVMDVCPASTISTGWWDWAAKDGRGLSRPTNVVLAFKNGWSTQARRYQVTLVGVAVYGRWAGVEPADSESEDPARDITCESGLLGQPAVSAEQLNGAVQAKRAAIIEILCRRGNAMSRGVGQLLVQHCVARTLAYTSHPLGAVFTNLVRGNQYADVDPVEGQYAAAPVMTSCGFRHIQSVRFRAQNAGADDPGTDDERDTGRWYALAGADWVGTFAEPLINELSGLVPVCPVTPRVRAPLTRC